MPGQRTARLKAGKAMVIEAPKRAVAMMVEQCILMVEGWCVAFLLLYSDFWYVDWKRSRNGCEDTVWIEKVGGNLQSLIEVCSQAFGIRSSSMLSVGDISHQAPRLRTMTMRALSVKWTFSPLRGLRRVQLALELLSFVIKLTYDGQGWNDVTAIRSPSSCACMISSRLRQLQQYGKRGGFSTLLGRDRWPQSRSTAVASCIP